MRVLLSPFSWPDMCKTVGKHECDGSTLSSLTYSVSICWKSSLWFPKPISDIFFPYRDGFLTCDTSYSQIRAFKIRAKLYLSSTALKDIIWYDSLFVSSSCAFWQHPCVHGFHHVDVCKGPTVSTVVVETARRFARGYLVRLRTPSHKSWCLDIEGGMSWAKQNVSFNTHVSLNATHFGEDHDQTVQINGEFRGFPL